MATESFPSRYRFIKLDKRFLTAVRFLFRSIQTAFRFFLYLIDRTLALLGYHRTATKPLGSKDDYSYQQSLRDADLDKRSFQSYGSIRWVSDLTPEQIQRKNRIECETEVLRFRYRIENEDFDGEIQFTGELQDHEVVILKQCIIDLYEQLRITANPIRTIDFVLDLGRFLSSDGTRSAKVPGFTLDSAGCVLALEDLSFEPALCHHFIKAILLDHTNYQTITERARHALWNHQDEIIKRIITMREYGPASTAAPFGTLRARPIIDRDTQVGDGVYLGWPAREAIVVEKHSAQLQTVVRQIVSEIRRFREPLGLQLEEKILKHVMQSSQRILARNSDQALRDFRHRHRVTVDNEVPLDLFVSEETGSDEHRALLAAFIIEQIALQLPEYLIGKVSIDRNWFPGQGNTWVRYQYSKGDIYIVDPGRGVLTRIDDYSQLRWAYERPEDIGNARNLRPILL